MFDMSGLNIASLNLLSISCVSHPNFFSLSLPLSPLLSLSPSLFICSLTSGFVCWWLCGCIWMMNWLVLDTNYYNADQCLMDLIPGWYVICVTIVNHFSSCLLCDTGNTHCGCYLRVCHLHDDDADDQNDNDELDDKWWWWWSKMMMTMNSCDGHPVYLFICGCGFFEST